MTESGLADASEPHAAWLAAVHRASFPPAETWSRDVIALQLALPTTFGVLHHEGAMVMARVMADESEILTLAVLPELRRRGLGGLLLRTAMRRAAGRGAVAMFLEVAAGNHPARALYGTAGFVEAGLRRRYYADGGDALVMRADLSRFGRDGEDGSAALTQQQ